MSSVSRPGWQENKRSDPRARMARRPIALPRPPVGVRAGYDSHHGLTASSLYKSKWRRWWTLRSRVQPPPRVVGGGRVVDQDDQVAEDDIHVHQVEPPGGV